jgi:Chromo (CHRromatin Organisation MOdifier) domain
MIRLYAMEFGVGAVSLYFTLKSYVLVQQHLTPETRLHTLWRGPMKVIKSIKGQCTLLDISSLKEKEYHSTQSREFIFYPARVAPLDVAHNGCLEFFNEKILNHTGNTNRSSSLHFKVEWQGYDDTYNSYEPWKNLRSTEQLRLFLIFFSLVLQTVDSKTSSSKLLISIHEDFSMFLPNGFLWEF